jgi:hypothetical protein
MHIVTDRNHALVQQMAEWLVSLDLPPEWAVAMVQDFERGEALRLEKAIRDQWAVSVDNEQAEHRGVDGLGQAQVQMASSLRQEIQRRYKDKHVIDDLNYLKKLERDHGFRFKPRYERKAQITVTRSLRGAA